MNPILQQPANNVSAALSHTVMTGRALVAPGARTFQYDPRRAAMPPRDYQVELTEALCDAADGASAGDRVMISLATGGGKTRVMNDFVLGHLVPMGYRVLVTSPQWELNAQIVDDACARYPSARSVMTYLGGDGAEVEMFGAPRARNALVTVSTLQTYYARRNAEFATRPFDVIVLDELHYGEYGKWQKALYEQYKDTAFFVGATATRRIESGFRLCGRSYDLAELVGRGVLARPDLTTVETCVEWNPKLDVVKGDFAARSLTELGRSGARNDLIVNTYLENRTAFGATILFACDVEHANVLATKLKAEGVRAAAVHCRMPADERRHAIGQFRDKSLDVIVNVRTLTIGVDIPYTQTIFLARPTGSDILLTQMIGRGSRRTATKSRFNVVDFVDVLDGPSAVYVKRPKGFLGTPSWEGARRPRHEYIPADLTTVTWRIAGVEGLAIQERQSFSIEVQLAPVSGSAGDAPGLAGALLQALPDSGMGELGEHPGAAWTMRVEEGRLRMRSPVFLGSWGLAVLADDVRVIGFIAAGHGFGPSQDAPIDVSLAWCPEACDLRRLFEIVGYYEPALASLAPPPPVSGRTRLRPARRAVPTTRQLADLDLWSGFVANETDGYDMLDLRPLFAGRDAVNMPLRTSWLDGASIVTWISLAMHILRAAEDGRILNGDPTKRVQSAPISRGVRGNISELVQFVGASQKLGTGLVERRAEVITNLWLAHPRLGRLARRLVEGWTTAA
ncbi:MAG: DEAD/DEAH box helicase family protein [Polyangiaceae bacterium]